MGKDERHAYLKAIRPRYRKANKKDKGSILSEFCEVCGYNRKYAIRVLSTPTKKKPRQKPGRKPVYSDPQLLTILKRIWMATDQMCSKKLKAALPLWLPFYEDAYEPVTTALENSLLRMSPATIDRLLKPVRVRYGKKGLCGTKPGSLLKNQIPIRTHHWDVSVPGFVEADTVAHCGNSLAGDFIWSLTMTDIETTWTENRATWNKGATGVVGQIQDIEEALPFPLKGFDCDNGSEFLNHHLLRYFTDHPGKINFTRSRPYKKNDNAHVEQKNWSHVRNLFGYDRLDKPQLVPMMNDLYQHEWSLYQNHFCPSMKLESKERINSKYRKTYGTPKTPFQRVMQSDHIAGQVKAQLRSVHLSLNPFTLKQSIERKLRAIFKQVNVTPNVRQRL
jgi:hypothetical protein